MLFRKAKIQKFEFSEITPNIKNHMLEHFSLLDTELFSTHSEERTPHLTLISHIVEASPTRPPELAKHITLCY